MRGEYAGRNRNAIPSGGSSPLARGILRPHPSRPHLHRIIPACAGNTSRQRISPVCAKDHPRLRGEYILIWNMHFKSHRIIPACAGNTDCWLPVNVVAKDHPRLRGEYFSKRYLIPTRSGSSPLARGILILSATLPAHRRIIPACAGNTFSGKCVSNITRDHPRLRGEYTKKSLIFLSFPFLL